jgi:hypothetical protein
LTLADLFGVTTDYLSQDEGESVLPAAYEAISRFSGFLPRQPTFERRRRIRQAGRDGAYCCASLAHTAHMQTGLAANGCSLSYGVAAPSGFTAVPVVAGPSHFYHSAANEALLVSPNA